MFCIEFAKIAEHQERFWLDAVQHLARRGAFLIGRVKPFAQVPHRGMHDDLCLEDTAAQLIRWLPYTGAPQPRLTMHARGRTTRRKASRGMQSDRPCVTSCLG